MGSYVGIDLHRSRSVIVVIDQDGNKLSSTRIENSPLNLEAELISIAPDGDVDVVVEAT